MNGKDFLVQYAKESEGILNEYFEKKINEAAEIGKLPAELLQLFQALATRGKRVRGALTVLGYEAAGGKDHDAILEASLAIEVFHAGILIQDDIMDNDDMRREMPAMHKQYEAIGEKLGVTNAAKFGESLAICIGDASFYLSWDLLLNSKFEEKAKLKASQFVAEYITRLVHGQILDIANVELNTTEEKNILNVIKHKTAEYTGVLPLLIGFALAGSHDEEKEEAFKKYGMALGNAFQIQDDILGIFGDEELGKPIGSDIREGKITCLTLHLAKHGTADQKKLLTSMLGSDHFTDDDFAKLKQAFKDAGSFDHAHELGEAYVQEGKAAIPKIAEDKDHQETLDSLITYIMERAK